MYISPTISCTISYVLRTISYVKIQVLAILTYNIVYDVVYNVYFSYYIVCTTYAIDKNVRYCTFFAGSCHFYVRHRIRYRTFFWRCRIRCVMKQWYYTMLYGRLQCRWFTSPKTYDIVLRRRMQYCSIRYTIRSIRYACLGRWQAWRDVLAMPLQLPLVLLPDPRPCRMGCIAQAQCRTPFPHWHSWRQPVNEWGPVARVRSESAALTLHRRPVDSEDSHNGVTKSRPDASTYIPSIDAIVRIYN